MALNTFIIGSSQKPAPTPALLGLDSSPRNQLCNSYENDGCNFSQKEEWMTFYH